MSRNKRSLFPEIQALLVLAARLEFTSDEERRFLAMAAALDDFGWARLADAAAEYRISGLLFKHLSEHGLKARVPAATWVGWEKSNRLQTLCGLRTYGQLGRIADAATAEGIDILLLKGAYLARWVYRNPTLRPFNDFDLLCRRSDIPAMTRLLGRLGFAQEAPVAQSRVHAKLAGSMTHHLSPFAQAGWPHIELHTALTAVHQDGSHSMDAVWNRAVPLDWEGRRVFSLSFEDQILHLSLHLAHHLACGLIKLYWFSDIREVIRGATPPVDWRPVIETAASLGAGDKFAGLWRLLRVEWGIPFPDVFDHAGAAAQEPWNIPWLFANCGSGPRLEILREGYLRTLRMNRRIPSFPDKLLFFWKQIFPDRAYIRSRYKIPAGKSVFFHYFFHLYRGCRPFLPRCLGRLFPGQTD
ncbi:MAG: nucleotidyltransferase family protein [Acidobacteriota bacterium]|nr:nucleotidyltransferase family protein [Acidobacteriota bacterium]